MVSSASHPLAIRQLDWKLSTTEVFSYFSYSPWAILLDSANAPHQDARYDIICAAPVASLVTTGDESCFTRYHCPLNSQNTFSADMPSSALLELTPVDQVTSTDDPFTLLNQYLNELYPIKQYSPLPFNAGAVGSFSYDLGRRIEAIPAIAKRDIDLPEMALGFYDWALIFDNQQQSWSIVHYQGDAALDHVINRIQHKFLNCVKDSSTAPFKLTSPWQCQTKKDDYSASFNKIHGYLHSGDCYQINLTQRFSASYQGDEWQAYLTLRDSNKAPFSAFFKLDKATILSISPERFIQLTDVQSGSQIQTKPIKGTLPRSSDPTLDALAATTLAGSAKDRAENLMIVDLLRNDIGKVATAGSVRVPHLFEIESFPAVHHLVSTVTATLSPQYSASDLLRAAFPGGSITGAPKIRAMEIIEELEPSRRSLYCGAIGYLSQDGKMDTNITIRTLVAQNSQLYCWAGGGIVADSEVEAEYQESFDKVSRILPALTPTQEG